MSNRTNLGLPQDRIGNPHKVPEAMDRVFPPQHGIEGYNETAFFTSWNEEEGVGLFIHVGRCPQDIDLWYAQTLVYLPDGHIASDRSWGRSSQDDDICTGNLFFSFGEGIGCWHGHFDGVAEIGTAAKMARQPTGSGAARPMKFRFKCRPAGPIWDMYSDRQTSRQDWAKGTHTQQILEVDGSVSVDGRTYALTGYAGNDHSCGVRKLDSFASHHFFIGALPGCVVHCISVFDRDGMPLIETGAVGDADGGFTSATLENVPPLSDLLEQPRIDVGLVYANGSKEVLRLDPLHSFPLSLTTEKDNINGIDWHLLDHLALTETRVRVTRLSDGAMGYANLERSIMRSKLELPQAS